MTAAVQVTMNNLMTRYGAQTAYGGDVALSVYGMVMKVYQIAHAMFVGVSSATQPINGYNFGAKRYDRVRATYRMAATIALVVSVGWFAVYQLFPRAIGTLFVSGDPVYLDACQHIFRVYMLAFFLYGIHMATSSFFQGIGRPVQALAIPLVRQAVVLIPLALLLSQAFGFNGALLAAPHCRRGFLSPLPDAGTAGVPALEKAGLALVSRRRRNQTAHRAVQLGRRGVRLFYGETGVPFRGGPAFGTRGYEKRWWCPAGSARPGGRRPAGASSKSTGSFETGP